MAWLLLIFHQITGPDIFIKVSSCKTSSSSTVSLGQLSHYWLKIQTQGKEVRKLGRVSLILLLSNTLHDYYVPGAKLGMGIQRWLSFILWHCNAHSVIGDMDGISWQCLWPPHPCTLLDTHPDPDQYPDLDSDAHPNHYTTFTLELTLTLPWLRSWPSPWSYTPSLFFLNI